MSAPAISRPALGFFRRIVRGYFRRHFHGVRVSGAERFVAVGAATRPLLIYANHGSWWDPMVSILLAERLMSRRDHFAPMDADALERYGILRRVGIFPVEMKSARGAVQFLRTGEEIVRGGGVLWVTPQGRFVDARVRPLEFKPGLATLAARVATREGSCTLMPLAIEYPFWDERLPECLLGFGDAVVVTAGEEADSVQVRLVAALEVAMKELQERAMRRDAAAFDELLDGTLGAGGFYALGQRVKAMVLRRPYRAEHTALAATAGFEKGRKHDA
jgi:1-acyl-sn-glycerol-3-phosphate acyltransferase